MEHFLITLRNGSSVREYIKQLTNKSDLDAIIFKFKEICDLVKNYVPENDCTTTRGITTAPTHLSTQRSVSKSDTDTQYSEQKIKRFYEYDVQGEGKKVGQASMGEFQNQSSGNELLDDFSSGNTFLAVSKNNSIQESEDMIVASLALHAVDHSLFDQSEPNEADDAATLALEAVILDDTNILAEDITNNILMHLGNEPEHGNQLDLHASEDESAALALHALHASEDDSASLDLETSEDETALDLHASEDDSASIALHASLQASEDETAIALRASENETALDLEASDDSAALALQASLQNETVIDEAPSLEDDTPASEKVESDLSSYKQTVLDEMDKLRL